LERLYLVGITLYVSRRPGYINRTKLILDYAVIRRRRITVVREDTGNIVERLDPQLIPGPAADRVLYYFAWLRMATNTVSPHARPDFLGQRPLCHQKPIVARAKNIARERQVPFGGGVMALQFWAHLARRVATLIYKNDLLGFCHTTTIANYAQRAFICYTHLMSQPSIVIIGHICIDDNTSENSAYTSWGSSVLYMAQYYQKQHGISPIVITSYGPDMLAYLPEVTLIPAAPNQPDTLVYQNDSRNGKRVQHCRHLLSAIPPAITAETSQAIRQADIVIVATLLPNYPAGYLREILSQTSQHSLKVLCPQGYFRHVTSQGLVQPRKFAEALDIVPLFDLVIYSEEDYPHALDLAKQWKQSLATKVIVTQSADGATIVDADNDTHIPTQPIPPEKIVDSVGCGDTFAATVAYNYHLTKNLSSAILEGHKTAGQKLLSATPAGKA
jgi:pfkB family carbohydrate kinase